MGLATLVTGVKWSDSAVSFEHHRDKVPKRIRVTTKKREVLGRERGNRIAPAGDEDVEVFVWRNGTEGKFERAERTADPKGGDD